jgi:hypothetical protein
MGFAFLISVPLCVKPFTPQAEITRISAWGALLLINENLTQKLLKAIKIQFS